MIYRGNDTRIDTAALTDAAGAAITTGTVQLVVLSAERGTVYVAAGAMTHQSAGVWRRELTAAQVDQIPAGVTSVLVRVTVGNPANATFERVETVGHRTS